MIDMHSHCLPLMDDGARTIQESLEMLLCAKNNGASLVAATPHCITDSEEGVADFLERRDKALDMLLKAMSDNDDNYPEILPGAEVYLGCDVSEFSNLEKLCYKGTNYLLVEMPSRYETRKLSEWIYNISVKGIVPVIAHVDRYTRYKEFMTEFNVVENIVYQINGSAFLSLSGRMRINNIFRRHKNFIVSSDMHNCSSRPYNLMQVKPIVEKKYPDKTEMLLCGGAEKILQNKIFS